jgi:hypothetical protein
MDSGVSFPPLHAMKKNEMAITRPRAVLFMIVDFGDE